MVNIYEAHGNHTSKTYNRDKKVNRNETKPTKKKSLNKNGRNKRKKKWTEKNHKNNWKTRNKIAISTYLSIIILNVSALNVPNK